MMPIHELNTKLRTIDTDAKKLKTEYEAVAKRRGREMLTEYSNEYLRMENTREYFSKPSSSSSLVLFPTKEENKAFSRAATRKRETAVLDANKARTRFETNGRAHARQIRGFTRESRNVHPFRAPERRVLLRHLQTDANEPSKTTRFRARRQARDTRKRSGKRRKKKSAAIFCWNDDDDEDAT